MTDEPMSDRDVEAIFEDLRARGHAEIRVNEETGEMEAKLTPDGQRHAAGLLRKLANGCDVHIPAEDISDLRYGAQLLRSLAPGRDPQIGAAAEAVEAVVARWDNFPDPNPKEPPQ